MARLGHSRPEPSPQTLPREGSLVSLDEPSRVSAVQPSLAVKGTFPVVHGRGDPWIMKLMLSSRYPLTVPFFVNDTENVWVPAAGASPGTLGSEMVACSMAMPEADSRTGATKAGNVADVGAGPRHSISGATGRPTHRPSAGAP